MKEITHYEKEGITNILWEYPIIPNKIELIIGKYVSLTRQ